MDLPLTNASPALQDSLKMDSAEDLEALAEPEAQEELVELEEQAELVELEEPEALVEPEAPEEQAVPEEHAPQDNSGLDHHVKAATIHVRPVGATLLRAASLAETMPTTTADTADATAAST